MLNLDILICLWECFVSHKSHRNIFKELPQKATAFLLSKEKQSQGVICQSFKQNGPFMNWHWMVSYSDIHRILKQRCILWLTSAYRSKELYFSLLTYFGSLNFKKITFEENHIYYTSKIQFICTIVQSNFFFPMFNSQEVICFGDTFILWKIWPSMEKNVLESVFSPCCLSTGK